MTRRQLLAIKEFEDAIEKLKAVGVIRSDKYLADIAEFICSDQFGLRLVPSGRHAGFDGHIGKRRVQVKFAGVASTTVDCGNPNEYDDLLIILGRRSALRCEVKPRGFLAYRIRSGIVRRRAKHRDGKRRYSRRQLPVEC